MYSKSGVKEVMRHYARWGEVIPVMLLGLKRDLRLRMKI